MLNSEENQNNREELINIFENLEKLNEEYCNIRHNVFYHYVYEFDKTLEFLKKGKFKMVFRQLVGLIRGILIRSRYTKATKIEESASNNYFTNDRIAVYTVIFGTYDLLKEPYVVPDNCDFFVITDREVREDSVWKKVNCDRWYDILKDKSPVEKNRFFKMNPHMIFPRYKFSMYVDGSIQIISDLTPLIYKMGQAKMAFFCHPGRDCVFDELKVLRINRKIDKERYREYLRYLKQEKMPAHFGMVECGIIVREHNSSECIELMEKWWQMFCKFVKRDQVLLPYILWRNKRTINDVAVLGLNIRKYYGIRVEEHA